VLHALLRLTKASCTALAGRRVVAFSASASPESFARTLESIVRTSGCICAHYAYPDHAHIPDGELRWLLVQARESGAALVSTARDAVRLPRWALAEVLRLDVEVV